MRNDSALKTLIVSLLVCIVCSIFVSASAVLLKPLQEANELNDKKRNILVAAGLLKNGEDGDVVELFKKIETKVVNLDTGKFVDDVTPEQINYESAVKDPNKSIGLEPTQDIAGIRRRPNLRVVYFLQDGDKIERIVLPIRGRGLWSTMYGFVALAPDANTIRCLVFYAHGETPGLGAEIDNHEWRSLWVDKKAFGPDNVPRVEVIKGKVNPRDKNSPYQIDGISGATITGRGVSNLVRFWLGDQGYGPMLTRLKEASGLSKGGKS